MKKHNLIDKLVNEKLRNIELKGEIRRIESDKDNVISELRDQIKKLLIEVATYRPMETGSLEILNVLKLGTK
tara:strand:+ start:149 stop:364 length:216 start_codon:yes stop_codon:yes gene_type:complete